MALNLLIDLGIIIIAGTLIALLARYLKQPLILAYILAGLIIGPIGFQLISNSGDISILAELGIAFLLFAIGIESNIRQLFRQKFLVIGGALIQVVATTLITFGLMQFANLTLMQSICIGFILAFSSTVIVVKMLSEKKLLSTMHGRIMIGFLLVQDAIAIIVLPMFSGSKEIFSFNAISGFAFSLIVLIILA